jgi:hypothetical protein
MYTLRHALLQYVPVFPHGLHSCSLSTDGSYVVPETMDIDGLTLDGRRLKRGYFRL